MAQYSIQPLHKNAKSCCDHIRIKFAELDLNAIEEGVHYFEPQLVSHRAATLVQGIKNTKKEVSSTSDRVEFITDDRSGWAMSAKLLTKTLSYNIETGCLFQFLGQEQDPGSR